MQRDVRKSHSCLFDMEAIIAGISGNRSTWEGSRLLTPLQLLDTGSLWNADTGCHGPHSAVLHCGSRHCHRERFQEH